MSVPDASTLKNIPADRIVQGDEPVSKPEKNQDK